MDPIMNARAGELTNKAYFRFLNAVIPAKAGTHRRHENTLLADLGIILCQNFSSHGSTLSRG